MADHEKIHLLTEAIYKNIIDSFNPGTKQLIATGRAFQKALHNVATASKAFTDCVYHLAESAQVCKGATSQIGAALVQIAEVQREINTQALENIKSFHAEVLIPMESTQDNETKQIQLLHKKYNAGHKYHIGIVDKANQGLKKHQKKTKSKFGFDQKEMQYAREVKESRQKLDDYHAHNLRVALVEERKRYCFLLERLCSIVRVYSSHHSKAHELLTHRLPEWSTLYKNPQILPDSSEQVLQAFRPQEDVYNNPDEGNDPNDNISGMESGHSSGNTESASQTGGLTHTMSTQKNKSDTVSMTYGVTMSNIADIQNSIYGTRNNDPQEATTPHGILMRPRVRAVYSHVGADTTQLTFNPGDVIILIGEERDGWHYGENSNTHGVGWFPLSFTEALSHHTPKLSRANSLSSKKVQSLGNLADPRQQHLDYHYPPQPQQPQLNIPSSAGLIEPESVTVKMRENRSYAVSERPMTMHGPPKQLTHTANHPVLPDPSIYVMHYTPQAEDKLNDKQRKHSLPSHAAPRSVTNLPPPPPPQDQPLPPAPPPLPPANPRSAHPPLEHSKSNPALLPRAPIPPQPQHTIYGTNANVDYANHPRSHIYGSTSAPSPGNSSSGYSGSTGNNRQQNASPHSVYGSSTSSFPPPPPNLAPPAPPTSDYDEDPPTDNPFANVTLKKTVTDDRSGPRVY